MLTPTVSAVNESENIKELRLTTN